VANGPIEGGIVYLALEFLTGCSDDHLINFHFDRLARLLKAIAVAIVAGWDCPFSELAKFFLVPSSDLLSAFVAPRQ